MMIPTTTIISLVCIYSANESNKDNTKAVFGWIQRQSLVGYKGSLWLDTKAIFGWIQRQSLVGYKGNLWLDTKAIFGWIQRPIFGWIRAEVLGPLIMQYF